MMFIFSSTHILKADKKIKHKSPKVKKIYSQIYQKDIHILETYIVNKYPKTSKNLAKKIARKTIHKCVEHSISHSIIVGLMNVESSFNPNATSKKGARGLMQIMHNVWKDEMNLRSKSELYDIERNLEVGISILKMYLDKNGGNLRKALRNYNGSGGNRFANKVLASANEYKEFKNKLN